MSTESCIICHQLWHNSSLITWVALLYGWSKYQGMSEFFSRIRFMGSCDLCCFGWKRSAFDGFFFAYLYGASFSFQLLNTDLDAASFSLFCIFPIQEIYERILRTNEFNGQDKTTSRALRLMEFPLFAAFSFRDSYGVIEMDKEQSYHVWSMKLS